MTEKRLRGVSLYMDPITPQTRPEEISRLHEEDIKRAIEARFQLSHDCVHVLHEHSFRGMANYYSFHAASPESLYRIIGRPQSGTLEDVEVSALNTPRMLKERRGVAALV